MVVIWLNYHKEKILGGGFHAAPNIELTLIGKEIVRAIDFIGNQYSDVFIDKYIIMPNHIHLVIILQGSQLGGHGNPPLHKIVGQLKSYTNKKYNDINKTKNLLLWQRSYYGHIIRNEKEYREIWSYIDINPLKWEEDKYYYWHHLYFPSQPEQISAFYKPFIHL